MKLESVVYLEKNNIEFRTIKLEEIPKTAKDVEKIYGCSLHAVLKTLVFIDNQKAVLAVLCGDEKVDINKLSQATDIKNLRLASPEQVKQITGCPIGGVSPFCVEESTILKKVIDKSFKDNKVVNTGSGRAIVGLEMSSDEFEKAFDGIITDIKKNG